MPVINKPRLITLDARKRHFSTSIHFDWTNATEQLINNIPVLGTQQAVQDDVDLVGIRGNVDTGPIRSIWGCINFAQNEGAVGTSPGPCLIYVPDTQQVISLVQNFNIGGFGGVGGTPPIVSGVVQDGVYTFTFPIITNGLSLQVFKLPNFLSIGPYPMTGTMWLNVFTFDITQTMWGMVL